jgi:hypothetical protein
MSEHFSRLGLCLIVPAAMVAFASNVTAQSFDQIEVRLSAAVKKIEDACGSDVKQYCGSVTPGEGRLLLCLQAHEDKISTKCDYALFEASRKLDQALDRIEIAADACWADIQKHCANIPEGGGRIAQCLVNKKATLTKSCQAAMTKFEPTK